MNRPLPLLSPPPHCLTAAQQRSSVQATNLAGTLEPTPPPAFPSSPLPSPPPSRAARRWLVPRKQPFPHLSLRPAAHRSKVGHLARRPIGACEHLAGAPKPTPRPPVPSSPSLSLPPLAHPPLANVSAKWGSSVQAIILADAPKPTPSPPVPFHPCPLFPLPPTQQSRAPRRRPPLWLVPPKPTSLSPCPFPTLPSPTPVPSSPSPPTQQSGTPWRRRPLWLAQLHAGVRTCRNGRYYRLLRAVQP